MRWCVRRMASNTFAGALPLRPNRRANSAHKSRNCSSTPVPVKFCKRSIANVAEQASSPLAGKCVVITRAASQSAALIAALKARGAEVVSLPLIQILPPLDFAPLDSAVHSLANFDWLIFTSQNAVTAVADRISALPNAAAAASVRVASVGKATADAAQLAGFTVAHVGLSGTAASLVYELAAELPGKRVLLPRSDRAASELLPRLQKFAAEVVEVIAYRTADTTQIDTASKEAVAAFDSILFFSPSSVHSVVAV